MALIPIEAIPPEAEPSDATDGGRFMSAWDRASWADGYNACRSAILSAAYDAGRRLPGETARDLIDLIRTPIAPPPPEPGNVGLWLETARSEDRWSTGEAILVRVVADVWNGTGNVSLGDLRELDAGLRRRVLIILFAAWT